MYCKCARVFVMMKEVSFKQMQLDLSSATDLHPSTKAAWETCAFLLQAALRKSWKAVTIVNKNECSD